LYSKDDVRALFVLLQCPLFSSPSTYSVYSHLLRQILGLNNSDHHLFVYWLKTSVFHLFTSNKSNVIIKCVSIFIQVGAQSVPEYRTSFAAVYQHPPVSGWRERSSGSYPIPLVDPHRRPDFGLAEYTILHNRNLKNKNKNKKKGKRKPLEELCVR
jgi:hypothetical protein